MKKNAGQIMIHDEQENMEWKKTRNIWINKMNMNNKNIIANHDYEENKSNRNHEILINFLSWKNLPVTLSQRMRDVMIRPKGVKSDSNSCWLIPFGSPDTYRFAPFMASDDGRAKDT